MLLYVVCFAVGLGGLVWVFPLYDVLFGLFCCDYVLVWGVVYCGWCCLLCLRVVFVLVRLVLVCWLECLCGLVGWLLVVLEPGVCIRLSGWLGLVGIGWFYMVWFGFWWCWCVRGFLFIIALASRVVGMGAVGGVICVVWC